MLSLQQFSDVRREFFVSLQQQEKSEQKHPIKFVIAFDKSFNYLNNVFVCLHVSITAHFT